MSNPVLVQVVGAPIACAEGAKDTWREVAHWAAGHLPWRGDERFLGDLRVIHQTARHNRHHSKAGVLRSSKSLWIIPII